MLKSLNIENIAVIKEAEVEFSRGLNVLTGETGAGKSIVVDSINAVLGNRTKKDVVRHGCDYALVTAEFTDISNSVKSVLNDFNIPSDGTSNLIISRKISSSGKSNCRINGVPATVGMLKSLSQNLINVHGQHDSQKLLDSEYHCSFIDMLSDKKQLYYDYESSFKNLKSIRKKLKQLTSDADDKDRRIEILEYQINELSQADIKIGEIGLLQKKRDFLNNAKQILFSLNSAMRVVSGDDLIDGAVDLLESVESDLSKNSDVDEDIKAICVQANKALDEAEVLKDMLSNKLYSIEFDNDDINSVEERLNILYEFQNKYGKTEEDMLNYLDSAIKERESIVNSDRELERLNTLYDKALNKTLAAADKLCEHRKSLAALFEKDVMKELEYLDMPNVRFKVAFEKKNLSASGYDKVQFLISTNSGEPLKPLNAVASGGELSRIMLAIKNILAGFDDVGTLIFDEIDSGVSGRASIKIGRKLKSVSNHTQVICVTHSAQIAAAGDLHLLVEKNQSSNSTYTQIKQLNYEQRKQELARIMGGEFKTDALLQSARELLDGYHGN